MLVLRWEFGARDVGHAVGGSGQAIARVPVHAMA
jgi:hypothetical protein